MGSELGCGHAPRSARFQAVLDSVQTYISDAALHSYDNR